MKVIVTGGRDFEDKEMVARSLSALNPTLVVEGGARGADRLAREWAKANNVPFETVEADWSKFGKMAGHKRNRQMLELHPEATVLAFPGGRGTANCVAQAEARKRNIVRAK